jgi:amino acid adenylation domain-containing protein
MQTDVIEGFRLSPQQRHLWSLQQADRSLPYHAQCAILIEGNLDTRILKDALQKIFDRHEILRTSFHCGPGMTEPLQTVGARAALSIDDYDLSSRDIIRQEAAIDTLYRQAGELAFEFATGPLLRVSLLTLAPERHMLLVNLSSLCADAASVENLVLELSRCYSACIDGAELSDEPLQYADAAEWQNNLLESEDTEEGRKYWRERKFSTVKCPQLPIRPRSVEGSTFEPHCLSSPVKPDLAATIGTLIRKYDTSPAVFFLACWQTLLWRLAGQLDFVVGLACDGRTYEGLQEAVGLFGKTVPITCHLEGNLRLSTLLERINESVRDASAWQEYFSWDHIIGPQTGVGAPPYLPVGFEFTERPPNSFAAGVSFSIQRRYVCSDRFALKLSCVQNEDALINEFHYDSTLFHGEDIDRLHREFQTLLESVATTPDAEIEDFEIVSGADRHQLLIEFNNTGTDYPKDGCVHQRFEEQVNRTPDNVAVIFGDRHFTYAQLNARANQLAHHLRGLGVGSEVPVAICMERCLEMVVGILGILKAGGAYVPLDPEYPKERLTYMLEDVRAPVLLTQGHLVDNLPRHAIHVLCLDSGWEVIAQNSEKNPLPAATAKDLAYVIYTSGSTGRPKGVMVEHGGLANAVSWINETLELSALDRGLLKTPITFDAAGREIFPTLTTGGSLVIAESQGHRDCRYLAQTIHSEGISILHCVPSLLRPLIEEPAFHAAPAFRALMCGGEALAPEIVMRFHSRFGAKLYNVYGPTEAIIDCTYWPCEERDSQSPNPIGRPIPNARAYILDHMLRPLPIGVAGNLYIGGAGLARGYVGRPDLTAEKFIPDLFGAEPGSRLYKTGDLARYLPDGNLEFAGRIDHQVKMRGFRIELGEIEGVLSQHPTVREAVVLVQEDGPGEQRLVAYVAAEGETSRPAANELRSFLKDKLPDHMVPGVFVLLDALPLTANGKVDRRALPTPDGRRPELDEAFVACRTPTEELLAEIWGEVLDVERVGIHDNFFQLGGHSLLATQIVSRIRECFQVEMPLRRLFEAPTIAGLAENIDLSRGTDLQAPPMVPVPRDGELPLSFAQQRLWFIDRLEPGSSVYNFPAAVRLKGLLNVVALKDSLNEIVKRHEALRTTFAIVDGRPVQVIAPHLTLTLPIVDLRELPETDREPEVRRLATNEAQRPFDLAEGPLVRATVLRLDENEYVGLLTMHHIVSDGWSTGILIRELAILYEAYSSGRASPLPALPIQYADFAHWQRQTLRGEVLETQLTYWKERLLGAPPFLELPADHPRPAVQTFRGAHQSMLLPKTVGDGLKALSRQEGVTLFMALLAAFKVLLHGHTNQADLVVGSPTANRNRLEIEGLIGFFVNTLVLRTDLGGNPNFRELLHRVRDVCLGAYAHQDLPFERLVEELHLARDLGCNPLFQVMFVLQNAPMQALELPGMSLSPVEVEAGTTHFDLTLHIADTEQGLVGTFAYNTDLFEAATITRMLGHFTTLLEAVTATPERRLSDLTLLTEPERQQLLLNWNDTKADFRKDLCIHQLFEAQAERTPDAIAIALKDEQLTYGELNRRTNQLANHLRVLGVGPEIPVGICLKHSLEMIIGLLGILKAGGVSVPLDPAYPKERLAFMLEDAEVPVLLTQQTLLAGLPQHNAKVVRLDSDWQAIAQESPESLVCSTIPENLAYLIYTSGSAGQPKGVLVSHGSTVEHCLNVQRHYDLNSSDKVLQFASLSFDVSLEEILPTLIVGASLVIMGTDVWSATEFPKKISEFKLTVLNIPTAYWQELAREWADRVGLVPTIKPRVFIVGGDAMLPEFLDLWQRTPLSSIRLINAYGPTETTVTATAYDITPGLCAGSTHHIPIGRPLANRETYILNKYGNPVPVGVPGELYIGGAGLARGYLKRADLTAENFVPNHFSGEHGARLYKTGDLARYRSDGNIEFLGRIDHQVKIRGFRIEPGEIEAVLRQYPAVHETIVVVRENAAGEKQLVAYVVARQGSASTVSGLREFLKEKLPYYMIPAVFVPLDVLPLTPNGKVDRGALPEPGQTHSEPGRAFVAPRNTLELQLTNLWEEVLSIRPIGVTDNFFELGGHSLAAVRLFALIEKRLGKKVPLATVFQGATVEQLANILREHPETAPPSSLVAIQAGGYRRPFFLIHPAGGHVFPYVHLAHNLGSDQPCYGLQARGLEDGQEPHARIEEMAAYYINAIRTVQAEGPYLLGGWSMGGVVAFEMAQQLHAQGEKVALLALLDARIPTADEEGADEDFEARLLIDFVRYFGLSLDPRDALARLPKNELLERVLEHAKSAGLMPSDIEVSQAQPFIELCKADFRATRNYELRRYPGRITLFKAGQELAGCSSDPTLGWAEWAGGGVDVHVVPGNHATMVYKPHVEVLAETLRACLDQVRTIEERFADRVTPSNTLTRTPNE